MASNYEAGGNKELDLDPKKLDIYILPVLRPVHLILAGKGSFANIISSETEREIVCLHSNGKEIKAAEQFLYAYNESESKGKWNILLNALPEDSSAFQFLKYGNTEYLDNHLYWEKAIRFFQSSLTERMNVGILTEHCCEKNMLTDVESEEIRCLLKNNGNIIAGHRLLVKLPGTKDWFPKFVKILYDLDSKENAKELDPCLYEKLEAGQNIDFDEASRLPIQGECSNTCQIEGGAPGGPGIMERDAVPDDTGFNKLDYQTQPKICHESQKLIGNPASTMVLNLPDRDDTGFNKLDFQTQPKIGHESQPDRDFSNNFAVEKGDCSNIQQSSPMEISRTVVEDEHIVLRQYQTELAQDAVAGNNVIICAPTGSGKTHVALHIIAKHLEYAKGKKNAKVIFLVNQRALADQQFEKCKKYFGRQYNCFAVTGDTDVEVPFKDIVLINDILIITAQILIDSLCPGQIESIRAFTLFIFDECHHTKDKHPFNTIMLKFMKEKYPDIANPQNVRTGLPQIVGLTASTGVGKAKDEESAVDHICKLCANLDAHKLCTVEKNRDELTQFTNSPEHEMIACHAREKDEFREILDEIMRSIEKDMQQQMDDGSAIRVPEFPSRDAPAYTQWISNMFKELAKLENGKVRRDLESARRYLQIYHGALTINEDCRTEDAVSYLEENIKVIFQNQGRKFTNFEKKLHEMFEKHQSQLNGAAQGPHSENPKLKTLYERISGTFDENPDSRAIVFVKTRELAKAIEQWVRDTPNLRALNPRRMVGAGAPSERGGMTQSQQADVMKRFRDGTHKLIIATSIAQEGLDIAECNLVIQYDHNTNEIAMVQARGRARAENSQYTVVAGEKSSVREKEGMNLVRELVMTKAIEKLKKRIQSDPERFREEKIEIQLGNLSKYILDSEQRQRERKPGEFKLTCFRCDHLGCFSSDIREIKDSHHIVVDPNFGLRVTVKKHPAAKKFGELEKKGKLYCEGCGDDWGIVIKHNGHFFPVIKIASFKITDSLGTPTVCKKWKNVKFIVTKLNRNEVIANLDDKCSAFRNDED